MTKEQLTCLIIAFLFGCGTSKEIPVTKWEDGNPQVTYKISSGTIDSPVDFEYKMYYPNGKSIFKTGRFKNGKEHGQWTFYYQSGKVKSIGQFDNGIMTGEFTVYYESGEIEQNGKYDKGQINKIEKFYRDGLIKPDREDLTDLLEGKLAPWTREQKELMTVDCQMPMIVVYQNATEFCQCIIDTTANHTNYDDFKELTEFQKGIVFGYFISYNQSCSGILKQKK